MKRILIILALAILGAAVLAVLDYYDSSAGTAPNGEPIGAQHPRSGQ